MNPNLADAVFTLVTDEPGLTLATIADRRRADVGQVQQILDFLVRNGHVVQEGWNERKTYKARKRVN